MVEIITVESKNAPYYFLCAGECRYSRIFLMIWCIYIIRASNCSQVKRATPCLWSQVRTCYTPINEFLFIAEYNNMKSVGLKVLFLSVVWWREDREDEFSGCCLLGKLVEICGNNQDPWQTAFFKASRWSNWPFSNCLLPSLKGGHCWRMWAQ